MKQNVAGQNIGAQMTNASDGSDFTGTASVFVTIDGGTQSAGAGTIAHEGNGYHNYAPTQAETNGSHIAFTFTGTGAISSTTQVYTNFPQSVDNNTLLTTVDAKVDAVGTITTDTNTRVQTIESNYSTFDPATDTVANVTTVQTTVSNSDMRGTDGALTATVQNIVDGVWDELQVSHTTIGTFGYYLDAQVSASGGGATPADIWSYSPRSLTDVSNIVNGGAINTTAGAIDNVTLVATTTTNTDMRGTDGANTIAPDNATISDTNTRVQAIQLDYSTLTANDVWTFATRGLTEDVTIDTASITAIFAGGDIDGYSLNESMRIVLSASAGKLSGAATNNVLIRDTADTKNRINANVDADGNRTAVTLDVSN